MSVAAASLANLRPPWKPGEQPRLGVKTVERALGAIRKLAPEAVHVLGRCLRDELQPMQLRIKCAEVILDKAIGNKGLEGLQLGLSTGDKGVPMLTIRVVEPDGSSADDGITITAAPEAKEINGLPEPMLSFPSQARRP